LYLTSVENIQRNRIVFKIESSALQSLFRGDNDVVKELCASFRRSPHVMDKCMDLSMLELLCSGHDFSIHSGYSSKATGHSGQHRLLGAPLPS
jgi:hypothetical protein